MDELVLTFFNRTIANPLLDAVMWFITYAGLGAMPALAVVLTLNKKHRYIGVAALTALSISLVCTLLIQFTVLRPRPIDVRLIEPAPNFPSFPSGHAAAAFALAVLLGFAYQRRSVWIGALVSASLISLSRVYLGVHYPSDIFGGAVLGAAIGAACYGVMLKRDWRWLLMPQAAIVVVVTEMANLNLIPTWIRQVPYYDKFFHALLFGAVVFWLNLWWGRKPHTATLALVIPFALATLEETAQQFSPYRTFDWGDLLSDAVGMTLAWGLSLWVLDTLTTKAQRHEEN